MDLIDERLQKTSQVKYKIDWNKYDTIIFGSSRTTYYNQNSFGKYKAFNYSFSLAIPYQFNEYLEYAKLQKKSPFDNIILGLDFYGTKKINEKKFNDKQIIDEVENKEVFLKYMSLDLIKYSFNNIKNFMTNSTGHRVYSRENVIKVDKINEKDVENITLKRVQTYENYNNYSYSENYIKDLKLLKKSNLDSNFIIYTTPLSDPFLRRILNDSNLSKAYYKWISDLVNIFDEVYFFTYNNYLSQNYKSLSRDGDHYYPDVVEKISRIVSKENSNDLGILINKENLNQKIKYLKNINRKLINEKN